MLKKVLLADDSVMMRTIQKNTLTQHGYTVIGEASNGQEAVEQYQKLNPDFVLLDISMDKMNGFDALKHIMAYDKNAVVIICSVMGQNSMIIDCLKNGAKDFVIKPFSNKELIDVFSKY